MVIGKCEVCGSEVDLDCVSYDWDYNECGDGKIEWFTCPYCGNGDSSTNVTYED